MNPICLNNVGLFVFFLKLESYNSVFFLFLRKKKLPKISPEIFFGCDQTTERRQKEKNKSQSMHAWMSINARKRDGRALTKDAETERDRIVKSYERAYIVL